MTLQPNTPLQQGRYRIIDVLGQGGFGITYLAEQVMAERKVCIKEFFPKDFYNRDNTNNGISLGSQGSAEYMERYKDKFFKEAKTIAKFDHPNIIHIFDVFEENNTCYYVMDFIDGESLQDRVTRQGPMAEAEALKYIREAGAALAHIHEQSVNHLDIKPSNIMVRHSDSRAILIDFGVAKHYDKDGSQTSTTPVGLSHGFAPIEQYREGGMSNFSPESDIYSLAATLYAVLTATTPPIASEVAEDGLPALPKHISTTTCQAIECAMQMRRKDRPHSIEEFFAMLDGVAIAPQAHDDTTKRTSRPTNEQTLVATPGVVGGSTPSYSEETVITPVAGSDTTPPPAPKAEAPNPAPNSTATKKSGSSSNAALIIIAITIGTIILAIVIRSIWSSATSDYYNDFANMVYDDTEYYDYDNYNLDDYSYDDLYW